MIHLIVPPATKGGVYDFTRRLQTAIGDDLACLMHLSDVHVADWKIAPDDRVVLQFSGYGFEKRGTPMWLLRALEKRNKDINSFGIFFHELYAFGPPWSSSFWLSPVQRYIARRLAELSDFWMTNREGSAVWLCRHAGDKPHRVLQVFSNVGEMAAYQRGRLPWVVVFGGAGLRQATYRRAGQVLFEWAAKTGLAIQDIGPCLPDGPLKAQLAAAGVTQHGPLPAEAVSVLLGQAMFGLVVYPVDYVAKSGVFAALCAHGVAPILLSDLYRPADGLVPGQHYLTGLAGALDDASTIGEAAWTWYQGHTVADHAKALLTLIADQGGSR